MWYQFLFTILAVVVFYFCFHLGKLFYCFYYSVRFSRKSKVFERIAKQPTILVYGDSLAFGTGASTPEKSLVGLVGSYCRNATIVNHAVLGFSLDQITNTFASNSVGDLVIVCGGGIDILFLKPIDRIRKDIKKLCITASKKGKKIILVTPLNLGLSPVFPWFLKHFYLIRSREVGEVFEEESRSFKNIFVSNNLAIDSPEAIPGWESMSAADRIHPNDKGHMWAFKRIQEEIPLR